MRIRAHAVPDELAIDPCTAGSCMFVLLEHEYAGALPQHKPVPTDVPGPARRCRIIVAMRKRPCPPKPADTPCAPRRLGAACNHHVGVAVFDEPRGFAKAVIGRRARADCPEVR